MKEKWLEIKTVVDRSIKRCSTDCPATTRFGWQPVLAVAWRRHLRTQYGSAWRKHAFPNMVGLFRQGSQVVQACVTVAGATEWTITDRFKTHVLYCQLCSSFRMGGSACCWRRGC